MSASLPHEVLRTSWGPLKAGLRSRGASVHPRPCQGVQPWPRASAAAGLVLATQKLDGITGRGTNVEALMARIRMYSTRWCGYCVRAKALLDGRRLEYEEVLLDDVPDFRVRLHELTGGWT